MKCYQNLTKKEKRPFVYITSPSSWAGLERPVGPAVVDSIIQCGLKCSHMGEECGAIQYHNMTQACTLAKVNILSWRPLNTSQDNSDLRWTVCHRRAPERTVLVSMCPHISSLVLKVMSCSRQNYYNNFF